jgi:hypothetical protein
MVFLGQVQELLLFYCSTGTLIRHNEHIVRIRRFVFAVALYVSPAMTMYPDICLKTGSYILLIKVPVECIEKV